MTNQIIFKRLHETLASLPNTIVVLKGLPLNFIDDSLQDDLDAAKDNPLNYFLRLTEDGRRFITHEEFLLLKPFVLAQHDAVYVVNNNLFARQYPIEAAFGDDTRRKLLEHFTEPEDLLEEPAEENLGSVAKLVELFVGLKACGNVLVGVYNDEAALNEPKVRSVNLFEPGTVELEEVNADPAQVFLDVQDETDYIGLIRHVAFDSPSKIFLRTQNYAGDKSSLNERLKILRRYFSAQVEIYRVRPEAFESGFEHREAYADILRRHWGYDTFRDFTVYDLRKLGDGIKRTVAVSQEQIISDIVQQVERCLEDKTFRDVFVTAPTGAGKSVIFQVPAIYLAAKYKLLTLVISPLIGLMTDQVKNLELKNYLQAETINSDISPILKEQIIERVASGACNLLYLSPETLLSRSDIEQLIGKRTVGLLVIDEAHIVTTWGKQFRPDYWFLGDHIRKLRKKNPFVIATFTATAIYHGAEDMYEDTIDSLHLRTPITYLGYVKRDDIDIVIDKKPSAPGERAEYQFAKLLDLEHAIKRAMIFGKKTLIYFPEVKLIEQAQYALQNRNAFDGVAIYHGRLNKDDRREGYEKFMSGEKPVMLATKAFGMGIDINDIEIVMHYAPTGNVCDYVQELGRAARAENLRGEARYHYDRSDFKYIKRLHGLSAIKNYQLVAVARKIYELYRLKPKNNFLLDAENFAYLFDRYADEATAVNKVKTALLIIQKDFEAQYGFSPLTVRPIPLFATGFFVINPLTQKNLRRDYGNCLTEIERSLHVCRVNLQAIWDKRFRDRSFPQFKYLLYTKSPDLPLAKLEPALCVDVSFAGDFRAVFDDLFGQFKATVNRAVDEMKYLCVDDLVATMSIPKYKARNICEVLIASMEAYVRNFTRKTQALFAIRTMPNGRVYYRFNNAIRFYFAWVEKIFSRIIDETRSGRLYITNTTGKAAKELNTVLGIAEALGALSFKMTGGANSQLYIHINQIRNLKNILDAGGHYSSRILQSVASRHESSVKTLTHIYEGDFDSATIWDMLEDYFLGRKIT